MKRIFAWVLALMMLVITPASALTTVQPNDLFYVYDGASVLSDDTTATIVLNNKALYAACGAQIVFVTLKDTGSAQIEDYSYTLFNNWGIGSTEKKNGILILMSIYEDTYCYQTGIGLESTLTAGDLSVIVNEYLEPYFDKADYDTGARELFKALYERVGDIYGVVYPYSEYTAQDLYGEPDSPGNTQGDPQNGKKPGGTTNGEKSSTFSLILGFILFLGILYLIYIVIRGFLSVTGFVTRPVGYRYWFFRPWRPYYRRNRPQPGPGPSTGPSRPVTGPSRPVTGPSRPAAGPARSAGGSIFGSSRSETNANQSRTTFGSGFGSTYKTGGSSTNSGGGGSTRGSGGIRSNSFSGSRTTSTTRTSSFSGSRSSSFSGSRSSSFSGSRSGGFSGGSRGGFSGGSRGGGGSTRGSGGVRGR